MQVLSIDVFRTIKQRDSTSVSKSAPTCRKTPAVFGSGRGNRRTPAALPAGGRRPPHSLRTSHRAAACWRHRIRRRRPRLSATPITITMYPETKIQRQLLDFYNRKYQFGDKETCY